MKKLYEMSWWQKIFKKEVKKKREDALSSITAVREFLAEVPDQLKAMKPLLLQLEELEKERLVAKPGIVKLNLEAQSQVFEKLLDRYEFFQDDVDINGLRVKQLSRDFLEHAKKAGLKELVQEKLKTQKWKWGW